MIDLRGQDALVLGGSGVLGRTIVSFLHQAGANVFYTYLTNKLVIEPKNDTYYLWPIKVDVTRRDNVREVLQALLDNSASIDIFVNCVGINYPTSLTGISDEMWDEVIDTNLRAVFITTQEILPYLNKGSSIIYLSSVSAALGGPTSVHYAASKGGLEAFMRGVAKRVAQSGTRANCVAPGYIESPMTDKGKQSEAVKDTISDIPMQHLGTPEDVAGAVLWLASDLSQYVTGQVIHVNGGLV